MEKIGMRKKDKCWTNTWKVLIAFQITLLSGFYQMRMINVKAIKKPNILAFKSTNSIIARKKIKNWKSINDILNSFKRNWWAWRDNDVLDVDKSLCVLLIYDVFIHDYAEFRNKFAPFLLNYGKRCERMKICLEFEQEKDWICLKSNKNLWFS